MDHNGLLYTPPACAPEHACKLVVALHGCLSGEYLLGDEFPELANLDTYADTNNLVILYPQAIASVIPYNPEGCWDWWGYDGSELRGEERTADGHDHEHGPRTWRLTGQGPAVPASPHPSRMRACGARGDKREPLCTAVPRRLSDLAAIPAASGISCGPWSR